MTGKARNGGYTLALEAGSPAHDEGAVATLTVDQRGTSFLRVDGAAADIGAYESALLAAVLPRRLDIEGDRVVSATEADLLPLRAMLGFSEANAAANSGITQPQWSTTRTNLDAKCRASFAPETVLFMSPLNGAIGSIFVVFRNYKNQLNARIVVRFWQSFVVG